MMASVHGIEVYTELIIVIVTKIRELMDIIWTTYWHVSMSETRSGLGAKPLSVHGAYWLKL